MKMNAIERTERREQIKATKAHLEIVVEVFKATREETPAATVAELVNRLGYETARETVAELVNTVGAWDGRIYEYVREWAQSVETAATPDELRSHDIYQPGDIHPAHINQIGEAMREYPPAEEIPAEEPADAAEVFPELVKAVNAEAELRKDGKRFYIENGFCRTWAAEHRTDPDRGLKEWSTPKKWEAYQAGTLPREKAVEIAQKRAAADVEKWREQQLSKLRTAAAAPALSFLSVSVEWKRSSTWGYNPTATARTDDGTFSGYASGCGYDKESAAVGEALNKSPAVMRVLYQAAEQAMKNGESFKTLSSGCVSWGDVLGYGSGSGRWFDTYTAERKGA